MPDPQPEFDTEELRRLLEAATPGPWDTNSGFVVWDQSQDKAVADVPSSADGKLIVALRNAAPELLSEIDKLRAEVEGLRHDRDALMGLVETCDHWDGDEGTETCKRLVTKREKYNPGLFWCDEHGSEDSVDLPFADVVRRLQPLPEPWKGE